MNTMLDQIICLLQHPFFMLIGGLTFWFTLKWSRQKNKGKNYNFFNDQKDEMAVSFMGGLILLVWDDEALQVWDWLFNKEEPTQIQSFYYLVIGPIIDRIYKLLNK